MRLPSRAGRSTLWASSLFREVAMPSPKYTVRLPETLHALVQEHMLSTRTPFAVLIREALSAYLAHPAPTPGAPLVPTPADTLRELQVQVAAVTTRVDILEQRQPPVPIAADSAPGALRADSPRRQRWRAARRLAREARYGAWRWRWARSPGRCRRRLAFSAWPGESGAGTGTYPPPSAR